MCVTMAHITWIGCRKWHDALLCSKQASCWLESQISTHTQTIPSRQSKSANLCRIWSLEFSKTLSLLGCAVPRLAGRLLCWPLMRQFWGPKRERFSKSPCLSVGLLDKNSITKNRTCLKYQESSGFLVPCFRCTFLIGAACLPARSRHLGLENQVP